MLKDFETDLKILQVIGHLIQWTSDLILHEVTSVRKAPMDLEDISTARQLLLIIRRVIVAYKVSVILFLCNLFFMNDIKLLSTKNQTLELSALSLHPSIHS